MASIDRIVKLIFEGDDRVSKVMTSIEGNVSKFSKGVESATQPLADLATKTVLAEAALVAMVTGGIIYATKEAGAFSDSFNEISTLIDASAEDIAGFKDDVLDYSRASSSAIDTITSATYNIISATGDWENSIERLTAAERLNIAGKGELNDTAKLLATSMNAYGAASSDSADYADVLFKTVKVGVTNLTELSASLGTVTGLASSAGVPFDDLAASVGALTGTVGDTSLAVTQVKSILTAIVKPSEQAKKAADELGIAFDTQTLKAMGLEKFLKMVYEATDGNSTVMAEMFGRVEGLNGALVLGADSSGKYADALDQMANRAGAVDEAYQKMADNMTLINQNLINNLKATVIQFGGNFLDEWGEIAEGAVDIFRGISFSLDEGAFDPVIEFIEKAGSDLAEYLKKVASALPEALNDVDFDGLLSSIESLGKAARNLVDAFFGDLDLTKPEGLAKAIQKIVDSGKLLTNVTAGIVEGLKPFIEGLGKAVDGVNNLDESTQKSIGNFLGLATGINKVATALNVMAPALSIIAVSHIPAAIAVVDTLVISMGALSTILAGAAAYGIGYFSGKLINEYVPGVASGTQEIFRLIDRVINFTGAQGRANEMLDESGRRLEDARDKFKNYQETIRGVDDALLDFFGSLDGFSDAIDIDTAEPISELDKLKAALREAGVLIEEFPKDNKINVDVFVDTDKLENLTWIDVNGEEHHFTGDGFDYDISVATKIDSVSFSNAEQAIGDLALDTEEKLKTIQTEAEKVQTAMEWEAKVDIAQVEAATRRVEEAFEGIQVEIISTGEVLNNLFSGFNDASRNTRSLIERQIRLENTIRKEAHDKNMRLINTEIKLNEARLRLYKRGGATIKIDTTGVYPLLDAVLVDLVENAQIRASEEGLESLIGL